MQDERFKNVNRRSEESQALIVIGSQSYYHSIENKQ